jgi:tRNA G37 N-methylase Trm5
MPMLFAIDINATACAATHRTAAANSVDRFVEIINGDMFSCFAPHFKVVYQSIELPIPAFRECDYYVFWLTAFVNKLGIVRADAVNT